MIFFWFFVKCFTFFFFAELHCKKLIVLVNVYKIYL